MVLVIEVYKMISSELPSLDLAWDLPILYIIMNISRSPNLELKSTTPLWRSNKAAVVHGDEIRFFIFLCEHFYNIIIVTITEVLFTLQFDIILMFFRLEDPVESHRNVFSINREIILFGCPSAWKLCILVYRVDKILYTLRKGVVSSDVYKMSVFVSQPKIDTSVVDRQRQLTQLSNRIKSLN